jgi:hypothetical protein
MAWVKETSALRSRSALQWKLLVQGCGDQKRAALRGGDMGECVDHGEAMDCALIADGRHWNTCGCEFVSIGFAFIAKRVATCLDL